MFRNIRTASVRTKKIFALIVSASVTGCIVLIWFFLGPLDVSQNNQEREIAKEKPASLFVSIRGYIGKFPTGIMSSVKMMSNSLGSNFFEGEIEYKSEK